MEPFIGQIMLFGGNFAPRGWAKCDGQLIAISQNTALFSIIGTTYGGDGRTTFALPDLRSRVPIHQGRGPGLSLYPIGSRGGAETVTLNVTEIPSHSHSAIGTVKANYTPPTGGANQFIPSNNYLGSNSSNQIYASSYNTQLANDAVEVTVGNTGNSLPHLNIQPFLTINYVIALVGIYPSRN